MSGYENDYILHELSSSTFHIKEHSKKMTKCVISFENNLLLIKTISEERKYLCDKISSVFKKSEKKLHYVECTIIGGISQTISIYSENKKDIDDVADRINQHAKIKVDSNIVHTYEETSQINLVTTSSLRRNDRSSRNQLDLETINIIAEESMLYLEGKIWKECICCLMPDQLLIINEGKSKVIPLKNVHVTYSDLDDSNDLFIKHLMLLKLKKICITFGFKNKEKCDTWIEKMTRFKGIEGPHNVANQSNK